MTTSRVLIESETPMHKTDPPMTAFGCDNTRTNGHHGHLQRATGGGAGHITT